MRRRESESNKYSNHNAMGEILQIQQQTKTPGAHPHEFIELVAQIVRVVRLRPQTGSERSAK
jgi:hypothetical protein